MQTTTIPADAHIFVDAKATIPGDSLAPLLAAASELTLPALLQAVDTAVQGAIDGVLDTLGVDRSSTVITVGLSGGTVSSREPGAE